ncbi:gamma-glutamyl-gamma-aminobutyrate hydrolase family protein [Veillonella parvula]|uniref:gamma-glutamyl-gamma-aminobutyrate hydrolase family protein n=1 Tax=Veillonella parvula TaxID=29466 RepID=UPI0028EA363A|nr:gamma-glutamyl-gamma-aminobutyrate hydrolase family protein [Veillonella parvula]
MKKPCIGVSGSILRDNSGPYVDLLRSYVNDDYTHSIEEAGGIPVIIPFTKNLELARETVARLDGLLLSGGHDVYPLHYGEEPLQGLGEVWPERDQFDFALIKAAEEKQIPIFGICRGLQILNVYRGGSLYQDLKYDQNCTIKHSQNQTPSLGTHTVDIKFESKLASAIGRSTWITNSHHHQTVKHVGKGLQVVARAKDGTVEGLEDSSYPWLVACQFHPEMMSETDENAKCLFAAFVAAAQNNVNK